MSDAAQLALALRMQASALINGEFVTGLEQINLLYEAADFIDPASIKDDSAHTDNASTP